MSRNLKRPYIEFVGNSALDVTGSSYLVRFKDYSILLEYGAVQTNDLIGDYKANHKRHKDIKPKVLDAIILCHYHMDHSANIPYLFRQGANCNLYTPPHAKEILKIMWYDSLKIMQSDAEKIINSTDIKASPLYDEEDIINALNHIVECDFGQMINITDDVRFKFYESNHIVNSAQVLLELIDGSIIKRIHYTSDLGSLTFDNYYCQSFKRVEKSNIAVVESTYALEPRGNKKSDRPKDKEKIQSLVDQIKENGGKIVIPVFSLNRSQDVLTMLYEMYHNDDTFDIPIVFDAPLAMKISDVWANIIPKNQDLWESVWAWDKIVKTPSWEESCMWQERDCPMIVLASGGFLSGGRAIAWTKKCLPSRKNFMIFVGYGGGVDSAVYKIKHQKEYPTVKVDGQMVKNEATVVSLNSFSSHIDNKDMIEYYSNLNCEKIILVHGDKDRQIEFAKILKDALVKNNKSTRVIVSQIDMKIYF